MALSRDAEPLSPLVVNSPREGPHSTSTRSHLKGAATSSTANMVTPHVPHCSWHFLDSSFALRYTCPSLRASLEEVSLSSYVVPGLLSSVSAFPGLLGAVSRRSDPCAHGPSTILDPRLELLYDGNRMLTILPVTGIASTARDLATRLDTPRRPGSLSTGIGQIHRSWIARDAGDQVRRLYSRRKLELTSPQLPLCRSETNATAALHARDGLSSLPRAI